MLYPSLLLGVLTFPFWGVRDVVREALFQRRFRGAPPVIGFDGDQVVYREGAVPVAEVTRARLWTYSLLTMASGAEEFYGLELSLRSGAKLRFREGGPAFEALCHTLRAAGRLAAEPENGGTSGGVGRGLMIVAWVGILGGAGFVAALIYD